MQGGIRAGANPRSANHHMDSWVVISRIGGRTWCVVPEIRSHSRWTLAKMDRPSKRTVERGCWNLERIDERTDRFSRPVPSRCETFHVTYRLNTFGPKPRQMLSRHRCDFLQAHLRLSLPGNRAHMETVKKITSIQRSSTWSTLAERGRSRRGVTF